MKKIVLMLLVLAATVANSQWQSVGNAERILASQNIIDDFVISLDGKYFYTLDNQAVISKWDYATGDSVWSRYIQHDSNDATTNKGIFLSSDAKTYCTVWVISFTNYNNGNFIFKVLINDIESNTLIDSCIFTDNIGITTYFENLTYTNFNYYSANKLLLSSLSFDYTLYPPRWGGSSGLLSIRKKSDSTWADLFTIEGGNPFIVNNSDLTIITYRLSSSNWYLGLPPDHSDATSGSGDRTGFYDINEKKEYTISSYGISTDIHGSKETGNLMNFSTPIFDNNSKKIIFLLGNKLYDYSLAQQAFENMIPLNLYPTNNNFYLSNSLDSNFFYVLNSNSINVYRIDSLLYSSSSVIDSIENMERLKNSPDSLYIFMSDGTGYLYRTKISDIFKLRANFTTPDTIYEVGDSIRFLDCSLGYPNSYFWDFGDGTTSTEKNPVHVYSDTGFYDVKLVVGKSGSKDSVIKSKAVYLMPELRADFDYAIQGTFPITVNFTNKSKGNIDSLIWNFDDSTFSKEQNPSHSYKIDGDYKVSLKIFYLTLSDSITKIIHIDVTEPGLDKNKIANEITDTTHPGGIAIKGYEEKDGRIVYHIVADTANYHGAFQNSSTLWEAETSGKDFLVRRKNGVYAYILKDTIRNLDMNGNVEANKLFNSHSIISVNCMNNIVTCTYNNYIDEHSSYYGYYRINDDLSSIIDNYLRFDDREYPFKSLSYSLYNFIVLKDSNRYDFLFNSYNSGYWNVTPPYNVKDSFKLCILDSIVLPFQKTTDFTSLNDSVLIFSTYNQIFLFKNFGLGIPSQKHDSTNNKIFFTGTFNNFYFRNLLKLCDTAFVATGDNSGSPACMVFDSKGIVLDSFTLNDRFGSFYYVSITPDYNLFFSGYRYAKKDYKSPYFVKTCDTLIRSILGSPDTFVLTEPTLAVNEVLCYPNPTNNSIAISFNLSEKATVSLKIFDYLGNPVETVPSQEFEAGEQSIELGFKQYSIGMYYYDLSINNSHKFGKIGYVR